MTESYDVIICGAGPAGASAAIVLAGGGANVLVLDRKEFPRDKLCGGALTTKSMLLLERVFGDRAEDLEAAGAIDGKAFDYAIRHMDEDLITGRLSYPLHFAKRKVFDHRLIEHALSSGADARFGESVVKCDPGEGVVVSNAGRRYAGKCIVGADGAASVVRRSIPTDTEYIRANTATGIEAYIPPEQFFERIQKPILHFGVVKAGYGWIFPTGHGVATGVCGLTRLNPRIMERFKSYLDFLGVQGEVTPGAHMLPYGSFIERPVYGKALLAGDAAGFADCLLGEGLYYAMRSGEAAGQAVLSALSGEESLDTGYPERLKKDVIVELAATRTWRKVLFGHQKNMRPKWPLVPLMRLFGDRLAEMVQGERSFRWGRKRNLA